MWGILSGDDRCYLWIGAIFAYLEYCLFVYVIADDYFGWTLSYDGICHFVKDYLAGSRFEMLRRRTHRNSSHSFCRIDPYVKLCNCVQTDGNNSTFLKFCNVDTLIFFDSARAKM